ncbi:hypothetical protein PanWU01x14_055000 [Parasponia andersonii]|uniref:Uncharacterized protein n=1 Tax=Parasponia andersonii TaxID=3476 RepID=A0A2P5DKY6_PARAD|nr:hypothetical protein PanWU01x14_055000 [Parasponia andersonii]
MAVLRWHFLLSNPEAVAGTHTAVTSSYHSVAFTTSGTLSAATTTPETAITKNATIEIGAHPSAHAAPLPPILPHIYACSFWKVVILNEATPQKQDLSIRLWTLVTLLVESSNGINREVVLLKPRLLTRRRLQSNPTKHHESLQLECVRLGESSCIPSS